MGVIILAILEGLIGFVFIVEAFGAFSGAAFFSGGGQVYVAPGVVITQQDLGGLLWAVGAVLLVLGIVALGIAWGLWALRPWARIVGIILAVLGVLSSLGGIVAALAGITFIWGSIFSLIVNLFIAWYLTRPGVRAAFEGRRVPAMQRAA